jgi:hypothetical protein
MENDSGKSGAAGSNNKPAQAPGTDYSPDAVLARINKLPDKNNPTLRIPGWLILVVLAAICVGGWYWYKGLGVTDIPLCVVNTSSDAPLEIRLDGKSIGTAPRMIGEDPNAALLAVLKVGPHELEARDATGKVVKREQFSVEEGSHGFLWTPLQDPAFCFLFQVTDYGRSTGRAGMFPFEGSGTLRAFPEMVTQWFRDNPKAVSVRKGTKSDYERALRRANCP